MSATPLPRPAPAAGGLRETLQAERASATPTPTVTPGQPTRAARTTVARGPHPSPGSPVTVTAAPPVPLATLQRWFLAVLSHPGTVAQGLAAAAPLAPGIAPPQLLHDAGALDLAGRMGVYHYAYQARLTDALRDDYPALAHALGDARFTALARAVIAAHPSRTPNLNAYGGVLAQTLAEGRVRVPQPRFAAQLAALEWAMVEVFHAPAAPTVDVARLQALAPAAWNTLRFAPSPTLRVIRGPYPVNAYLQAVREERHPSIPRPSASATAVYRIEGQLWRMDLTPAMDDLLARLLAGAPLGRALARCARVSRLSDEALAHAIQHWFRAWVAGGFFTPVVAVPTARPGRSVAARPRRPRP